MHPVLRKYEDNWATRCIIQARLKATSAHASSKSKAAEEVVAILVDTAQGGRKTRSKTKKVPENRFSDCSHINLSIAVIAVVVLS